MIKQRAMTYLGYIALVVVVVIAGLVWQARRIERQMRAVEPVSRIKPEQIKEEKQPPARRRLVPSRPEDYGMVVTSDFDKPKTQAEWNKFMQERISEVKNRLPPEALAKVKDKVSEEPKKTQEKLAKIDKAIQECREILAKEPADEKIKAKLEGLMILRAIAKGSKDF
jgi:hypothetical protein